MQIGTAAAAAAAVQPGSLVAPPENMFFGGHPSGRVAGGASGDEQSLHFGSESGDRPHTGYTTQEDST